MNTQKRITLCLLVLLALFFCLSSNLSAPLDSVRKKHVEEMAAIEKKLFELRHCLDVPSRLKAERSLKIRILAAEIDGAKKQLVSTLAQAINKCATTRVCLNRMNKSDFTEADRARFSAFDLAVKAKYLDLIGQLGEHMRMPGIDDLLRTCLPAFFIQKLRTEYLSTSDYEHSCMLDTQARFRRGPPRDASKKC